MTPGTPRMWRHAPPAAVSALLRGRLGLAGAGSAWAGSAWVWLALLRIWVCFRLAFGWISIGFRLRLDFGLILVWLDLDLV